uniref:Small ribosomal subunit protein mS31 n=1 Tax=Scleropages formosus TaxID=113540 RepID=A0A8D0CI89_SCLFO
MHLPINICIPLILNIWGKKNEEPVGCTALIFEKVNDSNPLKDPDELPSQDATQRRDTKEAERQEEGKPERPGKEKLLEILGQMKVEVVSKKPKVPQEEGRSRPHPAEMESTISMFQEATAGVSQQREKLSPKLVAAASAAAASLPDSARAESELLQQLRRHEAVTQAQKATDGSHIGLSSLRSVRRKMQLGGKRLNIFTQVDAKAKEEVAAVPAPLTLSLWDVEFANTIGTVVNTLPRNGFEEMIEWTKEGKLWKYPIDNEAGLEEEAQVPFQEHIFLEKHLDEGFPKQGPVRHFMELVVSGLARNPYLTVAQKAEHIAWYREYFQSKEDLLREAGAC